MLHMTINSKNCYTLRNCKKLQRQKRMIITDTKNSQYTNYTDKQSNRNKHPLFR